MKEETIQVRIYASDYNSVKQLAEDRDTTMARIIHEALRKLVVTLAAKTK